MNPVYHISKRTWNWLTRIRHRRGYGIHSPYAFNFVTGVVYESGHYYADAELKRYYNQSCEPQKLRLKDYRLLFRLANFQHPTQCRVVGYSLNSLAVHFMQAACPHTHYSTQASTANLIVCNNTWPTQAQQIMNQLPTGAMLIVTQVAGTNRTAWQQLIKHPKAIITFNLHDFGIIINHPELQQQHYIINYY